MEAKYLMGIDIGTTTSKGVIVLGDGTLVAQSGFEHAISKPHPSWAEHDAEGVWWKDFVEVCRTLLAKSGVDPRKIAAVSVSTMYPTLVPVDGEGRPLRPGILYGIDARALKQIDFIKRELGEETCRQISGNGVTTHNIGAKMLWLRENEPEVFAKTAKFLNASGYITYRLTGRYVMDHGSASLGGVPYRMDAKGWDEATLKLIGARLDQMPELLWANQDIGRISRRGAEETGLAEGTVVAPGTGDHITESLSQGFLSDGKTSISYGTTFGIDVCSDKLVTFPGLTVSRSCFSELYMIGGAMINGCSLTKWFRDNLARFDPTESARGDFDPYDALSRGVRDIPPGSDGLVALPYFSGEKVPFFDAQARGVIFGLRLRHTGSHIYRALLESIAFGIRHTTDVIRQAGLPVGTAIAAGGGSRSREWTQIVSDATGLSQTVLKPMHGSPIGAAFLGGLVSGMIEDPAEILRWNEIDRQVEPNQANRPIYDRYYGIYRELYRSTSHLMGQL